MHEPARDEDETHWDRRRAAISLHIEKTALTLFLRDGVDAVGVEQIAASANISQRTFFRYFPSRDDILAAAPTRNLAHMIAALRARPRDEHILVALEASVVREDALPAQERELLRLNKQVMRKAPEAWTQAVRRMQLGMDDTLMAAIEARLRGDKALASAVGGVLALTLRTWLEKGKFDSLALRAAQMLEAMQELLATYDGDKR